MENLRDISTHFGVPLVKCHGSITDIDKFLSDTKEETSIEGYVVRFQDGTCFKIKTDEYVALHRSVSEIMIERHVWAMILDDKTDDLKPLLSNDLRTKLVEFEKEFFTSLNNLEAECLIAYDNALSMVECEKDNSEFQKYFAEVVFQTIDRKLCSIIFRMHQGTNTVREDIIKLISKNIGSSTKLEAIRHLMGGIKWTY